MRILNGIVPACVVAGLLSACAGGGGGRSVAAADLDHEAAMAKMMELGQPTVHHAHLAQFAGDWNFKMTMVEVPGGEPQVMEGTAKIEMILDGHYLRQSFHGDWMGQPFQGEGTTGYDTTQGHYFSTWMDSMSTFMMPQSKGECSDNGRTITLTGTWDNPFMDIRQTSREIWQVMDINHFTFSMWSSWKGQPEYQTMKIEYSRQ